MAQAGQAIPLAWPGRPVGNTVDDEGNWNGTTYDVNDENNWKDATYDVDDEGKRNGTTYDVDDEGNWNGSTLRDSLDDCSFDNYSNGYYRGYDCYHDGNNDDGNYDDGNWY
ncbi:hypothetical protein BDZ91DRAFT_794200 [Kalaharituber pfeilii]|nr:hypothetical protein BDZ91DRAFT_794200 [Kalaharituber pfeilii]